MKISRLFVTGATLVATVALAGGVDGIGFRKDGIGRRRRRD